MNQMKKIREYGEFKETPSCKNIPRILQKILFVHKNICLHRKIFFSIQQIYSYEIHKHPSKKDSIPTKIFTKKLQKRFQSTLTIPISCSSFLDQSNPFHTQNHHPDTILLMNTKQKTHQKSISRTRKWQLRTLQ